MHIFESLAADGKLLCPDTKAPARLDGGRIRSPGGRDLGPARGPLNFLRGYRDTLASAQVPRHDIDRMRAQLDLPARPDVDATIAEAIASTGAQFAQPHLSAEARILAERFRMPAFALPQGGSVTGRLAAKVRQLLGGRGGYRLEAVSDSVGERLTAGLEVFRSVRVRNASEQPLLARRAHIVTEFSLPGQAPVIETGNRNELPVDLEPGREITLILRFKAPATAGRYTLRARLATGGLMTASAFFETPVEVVACDLSILDYEYHPDILEYGADHHVAMLELAEFLKERHPGGGATILEIGGGVHPTGHSIALLGHRVVASDISHSQSILGSLYFREKMPALDDSLGFISCDGMDLPFAGGSFDGVMLVAAFHHFAEPRKLLEQLKRVIRADGFVYLACETCVPNPADPQYREELLRGINEQMWTLAEFTDFFRHAGLVATRARVDGNSLKATLALC